MQNEGFFEIIEFLGENQAVIIDPAMWLQQLENCVFFQIVYFFFYEGEKLAFHFADTVEENFIFL